MDNGESYVNDSVLALLDCLALLTKELADLIASDNMKYVDRKKLAEDIYCISSQITTIRSSIKKFNDGHSTQGDGKPIAGPKEWPARNN